MAYDSMFQEAVEALRQKDKAKAKDLLTKLLKSDQNNVQYWIWLSAAVETAKEQIYCLQTALRLDPENATAKRGLVLLGALPPDESVQPFPLNRPRLWDEQLSLDSDRPKESGLKVFFSNPVMRLAAFSILGFALMGAVIFGLVMARANRAVPPTITPGPSPTWTMTPTFVNATAPPPQAAATLAPMAELLAATYTPTPLYVDNPRQPLSGDLNRQFKSAYEKGDWDTVISSMEEIARLEPEAPDPYYYIGEAYRFQGNHRKALDAYNQALKVDSQFGPAYLGLARARLMQDPNANVTVLLDEALKRDPNFGEVYLERAIYYLKDKDPELALADLSTAERLLSGSPLVYYYQSQAYLALEDFDKALEAAQNANQADLTMLPAYFTLGKIYLGQGDSAQAIAALEAYTQYEPRDAEAFALLGKAYYEQGDCEAAIETMSLGISLDSARRDTYLYRGLCYVETGQADKAEFDLKRALQTYKNAFAPNLGLMRVYILQEHFGDAYLQGERALSLAGTDEEKAQVYYWRAINFEKREEPANEAKAWNDLLALPEEAVSVAVREQAETRLQALHTPTPSPTAGKKTVTVTPTKLPATKAITPTRTPTPLKTQTP
ncbi:MAG: tetratricopeptide repeat protein [Chloroflexota bacterium]